MAYELAEIEKKISAVELKKKFLLFHDRKVLNCNNYLPELNSKVNLEQSIKAAAYKKITTDFKHYFIRELHRVKIELANHRIDNDPRRFSRYMQTNYEGLLNIQKKESFKKPLKIRYNSPRFAYLYERVTLHQIRYDLHTLFITPLLKTFNEKYQAEIMPSPYVYSISKQEDKPTKKPISDPRKLRWNGPVNLLVTLYYDLANTKTPDGNTYIQASTHEIADHILNNFTDKKGNELNRETILTILRPGKTDKRAPEHKKININF